MFLGLRCRGRFQTGRLQSRCRGRLQTGLRLYRGVGAGFKPARGGRTQRISFRSRMARRCAACMIEIDSAEMAGGPSPGPETAGGAGAVGRRTICD